MNEKLNIQDLINLLAEKHGMSPENADNFVKEFFLLIEESLEKDKYVKIKGLGTFKLIDVDSRESVKVNTGERFEIQGHTKVSFTPEPILKDVINKPFSHFETVVLNENTVLDNTPLDAESEDGENVAHRETVLQEEETFQGEILQEVINESPEETKEEVEAVVETPVVEPEQKSLETMPVSEEKDIASADVILEKETTDSSTMRYFIGIVVFVVALCGGAVVSMYYPDLLDEFTTKSPVEQTPVAKVERDAVIDSVAAKATIEPIKTDTVTESLTATAKPKETPKENLETQLVTTREQKKTTAAPFKPDSVGYTIVGTETTYTIKEGETLTKVALRFYGTKTLWPYIVKHNPGVIKNPDNVPFGTKIKIPKLAKKQL